MKPDSPTLTKILTYHVAKSQFSPEKVAGAHPSVQGATVNVTGAGQNLKINDAGLVCGRGDYHECHRVHDQHGADALVQS
jgi:uncharacterized surface protein with fasciclin (FAS1) repeats